ncbi:hypothetical protein BUALT_Bualt18G0024200 [Buddleja alternifolia]|uniref:Myb/SANT-like domain-containing protein n=1 Tax=Buddleja alternifolia TaxID=168488 RepID=A0AAV6W7N9_9LAMI|nr:hypothetical protein BUALT_Bualt18G0024200 [Buddleja alternifolia]
MPRGKGKNKEVDDSKSKRNRADIAKWLAPSERLFIEICYEQFIQGQLLSPTFSNYVWRQICDRLNQAIAPFYTYTPLQLQGKWNSCKLVWKMFHGWMTTHTGLGWDPERNTVTGPDDVLASLASSPKDGDRIIETGLQCYDMCTEMFRTTVATVAMARSSTQFALENEEKDTGTHGSSGRSRVHGRSFSEDVSMGCNSGGTSTENDSRSSEGTPGTPGSDILDGQADYFFLIQILGPEMCKEHRSRHSSGLQGMDWVEEILNGDDQRFYNQLRMTKPTFMAHCFELTGRGLLTYGNSALVSVYEEVMLFMRIIEMHHHHRDSMERVFNTRRRLLIIT